MNNQAPTYAQFVTYTGREDVTQEDYALMLPNAEAWIDAYIFPNSVDSQTSADVLEAYQKAISAVIACEYDNPGGAVKAYTAGKVHEELDASTVQTYKNVAHPYLSGSGLLCRWL